MEIVTQLFKIGTPDKNGRVYRKQALVNAIELFKKKLTFNRCKSDTTRITAIESLLKTKKYDKDGIKWVDFKCTDSEKALLNTINENNSIQVYKSRQVGFTTLMCAYSTCELFMSKTPKNICILSPNRMMSDECQDKVRCFVEQMPINVFADLDRTKLNTKKFKKLTKKNITLANGSSILFETYNSINRIREHRFDLVIIDEFDFIPRNVLDYLLPSIDKDGKIISSANIKSDDFDTDSTFVWMSR